MDYIYILVSKDRKLLNDEKNKLLDLMKEFDVISMSSNDTVYDLLNEVETMSLFSSKKAIFIDEPEFINSNDLEIKKVLDKILNLKSDNHIIISLSELPKNMITSELKLYANIKIIKERSKDDLEEYILNYFDEKGIKISNKAINKIIYYNDIETIDQELEKISLYCLDIKNIDEELINNLCSKNSESAVYELTASILNNNKSKAYNELHEIVSRGEIPLRIVNNISQRVRMLMYTKLLILKGYQQEDIMDYFNISKGQAYYILKEAKNISMQSVKNYMKKLSKLDLDIKTGNVDGLIGLEVLILND